MAICLEFEIHQTESILEKYSSVYFTPPLINSENDSGNIVLKDSSTQTQELFEEYDIPQPNILVNDFTKWLTTIDGDCYNEETSKKILRLLKTC